MPECSYHHTIGSNMFNLCSEVLGELKAEISKLWGGKGGKIIKNVAGLGVSV